MVVGNVPWEEAAGASMGLQEDILALAVTRHPDQACWAEAAGGKAQHP